MADEGQGVDPAKHDHVFEPFVQGDGSATRTHGGVGVGLAIAKKVIEVIAAKITTEIDLKMIAFECAWRLADLEGPKERSAPWKPEAESQKAKARAKAKAAPKPDLFAPKESTDDQAD